MLNAYCQPLLTLSVLHWFFIQTTSELSCFGLLAKNIHFRFKHIYLLNGLDYSDDFYTLWYRYVKEQKDKKKMSMQKMFVTMVTIYV